MSQFSRRFWADYTSKDFAALPRERLIAVLPVGAIEQHGPHLPLKVDSAILDALISACVPKLPADLPLLFLPSAPIGKSDEHIDFPGTLTLSAATLTALWTELGDSVARAGVRKLILLNSHGGQLSVMDIVARDLRIRHRMLAVSANWFTLGLPQGLFSERDQRFGIHGGDLETSLMLAIDAANVNAAEAADFDSRNEALARTNRHLGVGPGGRIGWLTQELNVHGAVGEAHKASAEKGRRTLAFVVDRLIELFIEVDRFPMDQLDRAPAWR